MKTVIISLLAVLVMLPLDSFSKNPIQEQPQKKIALVIGNVENPVPMTTPRRSKLTTKVWS